MPLQQLLDDITLPGYCLAFELAYQTKSLRENFEIFSPNCKTMSLPSPHSNHSQK